MSPPEIIGSMQSTYTRAVCMVCEEKRIEYVLTERPLHAPEVRAIHPLGKMPVLRHGDVALFESKAIATYLDRSFPAPYVLPTDPHLGALTEQWVSLVNTVMDRTLIRTYVVAYIVPMLAGKEPDRVAIDAVMPALREQVAILNQAVAASGHLVGDQFTFADINLLPILHRVQQFPEGAAAVAAAPNLARYYERHATRPSFQRTDPPPGIPKRAKPDHG
ncbi:glutathione S-transferase family protein [Reyranella sp. CPCC 100927]|uniref:glutathione S-transferase family protein n=1 Tax=Reyranella sp. CPCC 100927 TaxID=2599616 RepID=UPI0011B578F3|nr:glutathione S-transferase family protein [Reyranella sp. CPCC 100927]TWT10558.1 glutathione S-transferase family protein [Reyranella sp. CPCC 100927]